jgi:hypothetical protein
LAEYEIYNGNFENKLFVADRSGSGQLICANLLLRKLLL